MDRSNTVRASLAIIGIWIVGVLVRIIPETINQDSGYRWILRLLGVAAALRLFILFWQTLVDAVQCRNVGWVIGHFLFGPVASIPYYLVTKERPPDPKPTPRFDHFTRRVPECSEAEQVEGLKP